MDSEGIYLLILHSFQIVLDCGLLPHKVSKQVLDVERFLIRQLPIILPVYVVEEGRPEVAKCLRIVLR